LEVSQATVLTRPEVQNLFGIGRSAATTLMHKAGAPAGFQYITRWDLLGWLKESDEAQQARYTANQQRARKAKTKVSPLVVFTRFADLSQVKFEPPSGGKKGVMHVEFSTLDDLKVTLYSLARAAINEYDVLEKLTAKTEGAA